ncbi:MAG: zinc-dependent peptidase, partial [Bacteroidia bacterium]
EVDLRGSISLAWTSFKEGIIDQEDGVNVAIHEFAHAIYFENFIKNKHYLFINPKLLQEWNKLAELEIPKMKLNPNHFIRHYGSTNLHEFFAVSTEHFFEQPIQFKNEHAELYYLMAKIYNQDPAKQLRSHS